MVLQPSVYEFVFTESAHSAKKGKVIVIVEACLNPLINCIELCGKSQNRGEWSSLYGEACKYPDINQALFGWWRYSTGDSTTLKDWNIV